MCLVRWRIWLLSCVGSWGNRWSTSDAWSWSLCMAILGVVTPGQEGGVGSELAVISVWSVWNAIYVYQERSRAKSRSLRAPDNIIISTMCKNVVRTSQKTCCVSIATTNRLMLLREIIAVYCEKHTEHTTLCEPNAEFQCVEASGIYSNHWALKG
jgi:hypothetical protein